MNYAIFDMDDTLCTLEHRRDKAMESGKMNYKILFDSKLVEYDLPEDHVVDLAQTLNMFNTKRQTACHCIYLFRGSLIGTLFKRKLNNRAGGLLTEPRGH